MTKRLFVLMSFVLVLTCSVAPAAGQGAPASPNAGAIKLTAGVDFPSIYYFRGIRQEIDPKLTVWPYGDVGITLASRDSGLKTIAVNFGVWNSLNTGTSGSGKVDGYPIHYEEDFYSTLTLGFSKFAGSVKYIAYTSPNASFTTVKEIDLQLTSTHKYAPYGLVAFELNDKGQADAGAHKGTYLELGAGPNCALGKWTFTVPISVGLSLHDYYETSTGDEPFGFFDIGGMITIPLSDVASKFGAWNVHGRADYLRLGNGTVQVPGNDGKKNHAVFMGGIGLSY
jgi:hypothetical protein